jgi:hypothetical protein
MEIMKRKLVKGSHMEFQKNREHGLLNARMHPPMILLKLSSVMNRYA